MMQRTSFAAMAITIIFTGCSNETIPEPEKTSTLDSNVPATQYHLSADQTHNKFSRTIPPVLTVPSGAVIEVFTEEATDRQLTKTSKAADLATVDFDLIHPLTGPVYIENAAPGDVIAVTLHEIELGDWGWTGIFPGFGFLTDEFGEPALKTFQFDEGATELQFGNGMTVPLNPFPGVMGVAPDTDEMLSTIPPRANGGNMDDPNMTEGTTVYFPVFVEGALFSIGDTHAVQGHGEVCGTAVEAPMRIVYEVNLIKNGRSIKEPQYETEAYYAVTGFATTIDEAAKKATRYMVDYLESEYDLPRNEAYMLCSLAGDLKIAEVVDAPHMLVTMHMKKSILQN